MTILVVEDDEDISALLGRGFQQEGYDVDFARSGREAVDRARQRDYHAIILDIMLPGGSGLDVCRELRSGGRQAPIIMLSARDSVSDRVRGLSAGADDYVVKPFAFEELLARVRAQERRAGALGPVSPNAARINVGDITLDPKLRQLESGGVVVELTEREAELMALFMHNPGKPLPRAEIFEALWEGQGGASVNVVDVYVGYLRRKLMSFAPGARSLIKTVRGIGFVFRAN